MMNTIRSRNHSGSDCITPERAVHDRESWDGEQAIYILFLHFFHIYFSFPSLSYPLFFLYLIHSSSTRSSCNHSRLLMLESNSCGGLSHGDGAGATAAFCACPGVGSCAHWPPPPAVGAAAWGGRAAPRQRGGRGRSARCGRRRSSRGAGAQAGSGA